MKSLLILVIAFAIASVVLSDKDHDHHKKKDERSHHGSGKHHGERSGSKHHGGKHDRNGSYLKKSGRQGGPEQEDSTTGTPTTVLPTNRPTEEVSPSCIPGEVKVCADGNCPVLTCSNYDDKIDEWRRCLITTSSIFSYCRRTKCVCDFNLILDEQTGTCVKKSNCTKTTTIVPTPPTTTPPSTTTLLD